MTCACCVLTQVKDEAALGALAAAVTESGLAEVSIQPGGSVQLAADTGLSLVTEDTQIPEAALQALVQEDALASALSRVGLPGISVESSSSELLTLYPPSPPPPSPPAPPSPPSPPARPPPPLSPALFPYISQPTDIRELQALRFPPGGIAVLPSSVAPSDLLADTATSGMTCQVRPAWKSPDTALALIPSQRPWRPHARACHLSSAPH